jgi:hypothetical protein
MNALARLDNPNAAIPDGHILGAWYDPKRKGLMFKRTSGGGMQSFYDGAWHWSQRTEEEILSWGCLPFDLPTGHGPEDYSEMEEMGFDCAEDWEDFADLLTL